MTRRSDLDERFAHFCRTGEPAALGEVFDGTARELLHVAVWLAGNRVDAEDLLQRTFLCAIETRARFEAGAAVVPWLMGILAIEARHLRRERERRLAAGPTQPPHDPGAEVAAHELDAAARAIGEELGEPYRDVLRLHLQQGLNAKEIAERLRRPGGTVRTQLVRALEMLRKRLPSGFVAGFAPLMLPERAVLTAVRSAVMRSAELAAPAAAGVVTTWTVTGSLTMGKKIAALAAVAVLLLVGAVFLVLRDDVGRPDASMSVAAHQGGDTAVRDVVAPTPTVQRTEVAAVVAPPAPTTGTLLVQVYWQKDESAAASVGVAVWPLLGSPARQELLSVSDAAGQCRFEALLPGDYEVESASGTTLTASIVAGKTCELRLPASHLSTVHGRVVDEFERPVAGADIWLSEEISWYRGYVVAKSDAAGHFSVFAGSNQYIGARKDGFIASYWRGFHARIGLVPEQWRRDFEFTLQLRGAAGAVCGRVVDAARRPVAGARVFIGSQRVQQAPGMRGMNGEYEPRGATVVTDDEGNFARRDVPPGPTELRAWACGHGPALGGVIVQAGAEAVAELQLPAPANLQGVVRDDKGAKVVDAVLRIGEVGDFLCATTRSGVDGSYRFADLGAGETVVEVTKQGSPPSATAVHKLEDDLKVAAKVVLSAGSTTTWDPVLAGTRSVRGVVLDPSGQPMQGVFVGLEPWMGGGGSIDCPVDKAGRFVFTDVAPTGTQILAVRQNLTYLRRVPVPPGQDEVTVRLVEEDLPTAALRLRLIDVAGAVFAGRVMYREQGGNTSFVLQQDPATGVVRVESMRPGRYDLTVCTDEMVLPLPPLHVGAHESRDLGDIVMPTPTRLHVHVSTATGAPASAGWIDMVDAMGQSCVMNPPQLSGGELEVVAPPGTWTLIVSSRAATATTMVTLQPGSTTECRVTLLECREVPLAIEPDPAVFAFGMVRVLAHMKGGALRWCGNVIARRDGSLVSSVSLTPGEYEFSAIGPDDSRGTATITVPAEGAVAPVRIDLRASR